MFCNIFKILCSKLSLPLPFREGIGVALLLLVGPTSLMAQMSDPFGEVDSHDYYSSMSLTVMVKMNGDTLKDITPAVFSGTQLRGKGELSSKNPGVYFITVYGDQTGEPLHFKVFSGGRIIETDDGMSFIINDVKGSPKHPYIVDLPAPVISMTSVEGWATTCLPFNAEIPEGVTTYTATGIEDGELKVTALTGNILPKNTPVLIKANGKNSVEWLSRIATVETPTTNIFSGTNESMAVEPNSVLTLGHNKETGEIGFWCYSGSSIAANRAYIANIPAGSRGMRIVCEPTGVSNTMRLHNNGKTNEKVYDISGRQLSSKPTTRSIYVKHGKKVILR